jgi:hypothetical protein
VSRFKRNPGLVKQLAREPWAREMLRENAEAVEREAKRNSPLGSSFVGYYDRFVTRVHRDSATVGNQDFAAHLVEWGSINNPAYAPLRRGVAAAGLEFADTDKPPANEPE